MDMIHAQGGAEAVKLHRDNISNVVLMSLFSGLGGAELLMQANYVACHAKCVELGLEPPLKPRTSPQSVCVWIYLSCLGKCRRLLSLVCWHMN